MAKGYLVVKYLVFVVTVVCACVAIDRFVSIKHWSEPDALVAPDLSYDDSAPLAFRNVDPVLNEHYLKCILQPSKPFCLLSTDKRLELFQSDHPGRSPNVEIIEGRLGNITTDLQDTGRSMYQLIANFLSLMESSRIKAIIIEPSILFCMLPSSKKYSLLSRGFNPGQLQGSRNIATFGIYDRDSMNLNERNVTDALLSAGFKIMKIRKWTKSWNPTQNGRFLTVHYFFIRQEMAVHVVVFYRRSSYLWHAGLNPEELDFDGLLFVDDGIFENPILEGIPGPPMDNVTKRQLFIPKDVPYFLKETESSKYVDCRTAPSLISVHKHPFLTTEQLSVRAAISLRDLKTVLAPHMAVFWLWSRSLLGWSEHCNILHYTTILELGLTMKSMQGSNLASALAESDFLQIVNYTFLNGSEFHLDGRGLLINITILQEDGGELWYKRSDGQNTYKVRYEVFPVCSTDIFGQKVNIPCNANGVTPLENKRTTESEEIWPKLENNQTSTESEEIWGKLENKTSTESGEIRAKLENNQTSTESEETLRKLGNKTSTESEEIWRKFENKTSTESGEIWAKLENNQTSSESEDIWRKLENQTSAESGEIRPKLEKQTSIESEDIWRKLENKTSTESEDIWRKLVNKTSTESRNSAKIGKQPDLH